MPAEIFVNGLPAEALFLDMLVKPQPGGTYRLTVPWEWRLGPVREVHEVYTVVPTNAVSDWKQGMESIIAFIAADPHDANGVVPFDFWEEPPP